jgi:hypothetical protein
MTSQATALPNVYFHTSNTSMRETESFFGDRVISKDPWAKKFQIFSCGT